ncbi:MAG: TlpA family protein disulfide reductase [Thermoguttaceae bacterium]|nr:TlpA family protein disulfide reductase [Thermoguttaceae bacterium]
MKSRFFLLSLCLIFSLGFCASVNAKEKAADSQKETAAAAVDAIPEVPENGTLKEYKEYIEKLNEAFRNKARIMINVAQANHVSFRSEEFSKPFNSMAKEYMDRIFQATDKALLLKDVSDKDCEELVNRKIQLLQALAQINNDGEDAFTAELEALAAQLRKIGKTKLAENIEGKLLQNKIIGYVRSGDVKKFSKIAAEIDEKVEKAGKDITPPLAVQAMIIVLGAKDLKEYKAPEDRQAKYLKALSEASDPEVQKLAFQLENAIRRAEGEKRFNDTLGKEFKFGGTFTDGSEYKAEDYVGKVVLIDFWATWCGPCCEELPNVKRMYNAYHDKGFEVIGVTLDDPDKAEKKLNTFLKFNDIPWKQMYDKNAVVPGVKNKDGKPVTVSEYYSITAIPCPVLIGKDGKVISLNARDIELKEQLVKIYGEVASLEDADEDADEEDDQAADEPIPDVPENGTLADYREYVKKVNDMLDKKANRMERQAKKNGADPRSEEFFNSLREMEKEYFSRIEKALDKAILLKDIPDEEFDALFVAKLQLIQILTQLSDEKVNTFNAKMQAFVDQLRKMGKEERVKDLEVIILRVKMHEYVESNNVEEFAKAALEVDERVKNAGKDITPDLAQLALVTVMGSKELSEYKAPEGRNDNYLKAFAEASDPEVQKFVDVLKTVINQKKDEK